MFFFDRGISTDVHTYSVDVPCKHACEGLDEVSGPGVSAARVAGQRVEGSTVWRRKKIIRKRITQLEKAWFQFSFSFFLTGFHELSFETSAERIG